MISSPYIQTFFVNSPDHRIALIALRSMLLRSNQIEPFNHSEMIAFCIQYKEATQISPVLREHSCTWHFQSSMNINLHVHITYIMLYQNFSYKAEIEMMTIKQQSHIGGMMLTPLVL